MLVFFCIYFSLKHRKGRDLQDGGRVKHGDHLPPHKYIRNTSTCGTTPAEHLLNSGRRPQTSQKIYIFFSFFSFCECVCVCFFGWFCLYSFVLPFVPGFYLSVLFVCLFCIGFSACNHWWICFLVSLLSSFFFFYCFLIFLFLIILFILITF